MSRLIRQNEGINPAVYRSLDQTMRFAALFRRFRANDRRSFEQFVASLRGVPVTPRVQTPTVMIPPGAEVDVERDAQQR